MTAALLLGVAVLVGLAAPRPAARLRRLVPPTSPVVATTGLSPRVVRSACVLAGVGAWAVLGGVAGLGIGLAAALWGPRLVAGLRTVEGQDEQVAQDLPLALDLLAACLAGGAVTLDAVRAVAAALGGPCGERLGMVAGRLAVGSPAAEAWASLGSDRGPAGAAARAMARAAVGGAPVAAAVQRVADDTRRERRAAAERAARRAGVLAVGPLGLCFLPAFLLIGVVPAVIGLATPLLSSL
ncbi:MAG: rane protein [Frankiales bacterium]|nr:rane protein [Frankiales bacterium]